MFASGFPVGGALIVLVRRHVFVPPSYYCLVAV